MGLKLGGGLLKCGTCGKPRGITHTCVTRATSRRRKTRTKLHPHLTLHCSTCGKRIGNPLTHTCRTRTDYKSRKRKKATADKRARRQARKKRAAAERRARDKARRAKASKRPRPRPHGDSHEPGTCGDKDCPKYGCVAYWHGMADCPGPHEGAA